jgi:ElaB/YqjD/DUF883 family membrane-anchored ribosome-binding protein
MDVTGTARGTIKDIKSTTEELLEQAADVGERLQQSANDALRRSKRALGRLEDSAEDALDETKQNIRKHPFESIAIAAAAGAGIGLLIGYALSSRRR